LSLSVSHLQSPRTHLIHALHVCVHTQTHKHTHTHTHTQTHTYTERHKHTHTHTHSHKHHTLLRTYVLLLPHAQQVETNKLKNRFILHFHAEMVLIKKNSNYRGL